MNMNCSDRIQLQLFISCRKLKDVEIFSKSDPYVDVYEKTSSQQYCKIGQTEVIWDNLNPDFIKSFTLDYYFEEQKHLYLGVYDANILKGKEVQGEFIGEVECTLGEIVGSRHQQVVKTLYLPGKTKSRGNIILRTERIISVNLDQVDLTFRSSGLNDRANCCSLFCQSKFLFYLSRVMANGVRQRIYTSEIRRGINPAWQAAQKTMHEICNGDPEQVLIFELFDFYRSGNHKLLGSFEFSLTSINNGARTFILRKENKKEIGSIEIFNFKITPIYSFLEYIEGGCQINLVIAIDFTASNKDPSHQDSLHFIKSSGYNHYQSALHSVTEILLNYDSDKQVPLFGFGAKIEGVLNHCFPLNLDESNPSVFELTGIMHSYRQILNEIEFSGPTLFSHVIKKTIDMADEAQINQFNQQYFILLILTDGDINDMNDTIDLIVKGSTYPLSIVIVGIGQGSFKNMEILDADEVPLIDSKGIRMKRDIVQFVPFSKFGNSPTSLTKEVLAEIPREIANFFKIQNIKPNAIDQETDKSKIRMCEKIDINQESMNNDYDHDDMEIIQEDSEIDSDNN